MRIASILDAKGHDVETTSPHDTVASVVHRQAALNIGALVVSSDATHVDGIISEQEVTRGLVKFGAEILNRRVSEVMARAVPVCSPDDTVKDVMAVMTRTRRRHIPVVDSGQLCGIVSIGDLVKHRVDEIELEANVLRDAYLGRG
jgi:signal-transduction protein with cAMP-binding, CBS, and nucleotidyltransferase domain